MEIAGRSGEMGTQPGVVGEGKRHYYSARIHQKRITREKLIPVLF